MRGTDLDLRSREPDAGRSRLATAAVVALAALAVLAGALTALELLHPVYRISGDGRATIETSSVAAAILTGRLMIETVDRGRQLRDLLLLLGICSLAVGGLSYWVGPVVAGVPAGASGTGARLACELLGAFALLGAALTPPSVIIAPLRGRARAATALGIGAAVATAVLAEVLTAHTSATPTGAATAPFSGHTVAMAVDLLAAATLAVAGLAFVAQSWAQRGTELVAMGLLLLAAGSAQFVAEPNVPANLVMVGDAARVLGFALVLGGAYLRFAAARRSDAAAAVRAERERVARDLHDGLAQDLACITTEAQRLDCQFGAEHPLMLATRDALAELRELIADLTASAASTSEEAVQLLAQDLGRRLDVEVNVRADTGVPSGADSARGLGPRDDLLRATREAITHAALDGEARQVDVALSCRNGHVVVRAVSGGTDSELDGTAGGAARKRGPAASRLSTEWSRRTRRPRPV